MRVCRSAFRTRLLAGAAMVFAFSAASFPGAAVESADLILDRGQILTPSGFAQALAVRDGVIVAIGDSGTVSALASEATEVVDLDGATVIPGLHDMHVHPLGSGQMHQQCRFPQGSPPEVVLNAVKKCVSERKKGEWIVGGQWDAASFGDTPPHRALLDKVAPDNPVVLSDISMHSVWANSKALAIAGVDASTANPPGGVIERGAKGEPTGILRETAGHAVRAKVPPSTPEQNVAALKWALDYMLSQGVTSFTDAGVDEATLQAYATLADTGELKHRVRACQMWRPRAPGSSGANDFLGQAHYLRNLYARDRLSPDCIKIGLDGVPTDGHTAAMVEPYADAVDPKDPRAKGILMVPAATLKAALIAFDAHGFTVKMHAAGDAAVRAGLDAVEAARKANGFSGILHDVSHNSFVQMSDIERARGLAATFEMSPYIWYPNPIIPDIEKAIGPERMKRWTPVKDAIDAGALVVPGSDWAVVPSINPFIAIETLVTRQQLGGGGETLGAVERIAIDQAMEMFTVNAARQMGHRDRIGTLERGMLADMVVVDRNLFKVAITEVHKTKVTMTVIDGEIVYRAPQAD